MAEHEYGNWYKGQTNIYVTQEVHKKLTQIRELYRMNEHRNITLGGVVEGILNRDELIVDLLNEVNSD